MQPLAPTLCVTLTLPLNFRIPINMIKYFVDLRCPQYKGSINCPGRVSLKHSLCPYGGIHWISLTNSTRQGNGSSSWSVREKRDGPGITVKPKKKGSDGSTHHLPQRIASRALSQRRKLETRGCPMGTRGGLNVAAQQEPLAQLHHRQPCLGLLLRCEPITKKGHTNKFTGLGFRVYG